MIFIIRGPKNIIRQIQQGYRRDTTSRTRSLIVSTFSNNFDIVDTGRKFEYDRKVLTFAGIINAFFTTI